MSEIKEGDPVRFTGEGTAAIIQNNGLYVITNDGMAFIPFDKRITIERTEPPEPSEGLVMIDRIEVKCPLCGESVRLSLSIVPKVTFTNNYKGFLTAEVSISGIEHGCKTL